MKLVNTPNRQTGIGLLELMLVIVLAGVITIMSVSYFQTVTANQKITQANAMIADIYTASKDYVKSQGTGSTGDFLQQLIDAGFLTTYYLRNPWSGTVTVVPSSTNNVVSQITITMDKIPIPQCNRLVTRLQQTFSNPVGASGTENATCQAKSGQLLVLYDLY